MEQQSKVTIPEVQIYENACIACGACEDACPTDVIYLRDSDGKPFIKYPEDCQACFLCEFACPTDAIRIVTHRWIKVER